MLPCYVAEERIAIGQLIGTTGHMSAAGELLARPYRKGDQPVGVATQNIEAGEKFHDVTARGSIVVHDADQPTVIEG